MHLETVILLLALTFALVSDSRTLSTVDPSQISVANYAPNTSVPCPDFSATSLIRQFTTQNQTLHSMELEYISGRIPIVLQAWSDWLGNGSSIGYNLSSFPAASYPKIGLAIPGGGLRAAQYGAGCLNGLDARNNSAKAAGTGGLLQVSSYLSGLSGGSWVTGSLFFNNWPTIEELVFGNNQDLEGWLLDLPLVTPDGSDLFSVKNQYFFGSILWSVMAKAASGIDTSITDPWARMISYHFLNQTSRKDFFTNDTAHGAGQLWSHIPLIPAYRQYQTPFPIIVTDSRPAGSNMTTVLPLESVVYEITPYELASYDPNLSTGMNLTYVGTKLSKGKPDDLFSCVTGFDQAGFIMGTSASLFNQLFDFAHNKIEQFSNSDSSGILYVLSRQLQDVRTRADDVANWPNPFNGLKSQTFEDFNSTWLELLDGASNQENIPYGPLFVKARGLDVIVTIEGSADDPVNNWPNGSSLLFTALRLSEVLRETHQQFPPIPSSPEEFIEMGVNARPTFFGCDPPNGLSDYPLVIYLPNAPPITGDNPVTNTLTFQLSYTLKHTRLFIDQVHFNTISGFTPSTNSPDLNWGTCLQCAAFDRARLKVQPVPPRSNQCQSCFKQYCFDPSQPPNKSELPNRKLQFVDPDPQGFSKLLDFFSKNKFKLLGGLIGLVVFTALLVGSLLLWKKYEDQREMRYRRVKNLHEDGETLFQSHSFTHPSSESYELPATDTSIVHREL